MLSAKLFMVFMSVCTILIAAGLAYFDGTLFPKQMMEKYPHGYSYSFIANGAMWANLVIMSVVFYVIGDYYWQWSTKEILIALVLGMAVSYTLFNFVYLRGKFPDSLAGGGRPISDAGWIIMVYAGTAFAAIGLFYLRVTATAWDILIVGCLLALYIPIANHVVLWWLNNYHHWPWCADVFKKESSPLTFIIWGEIAVVVGTALKLGMM